MKYRLLFMLLLGAFYTCLAQGIVDATIEHDDLNRSYFLYVPDLYDGTEEVPLVICFHGYTSSATTIMGYSKFNAIADTANFIVVYPQGTLLNGNSHWNVGGWTLSSTVDDVGFVDALIDHLASNYKIDPNRIYSTGMSNGGFMSFLLACQLSHRITAVASVTGSMTPQTYNACNPQHPTPVLQFHGDSDFVVPYEGNPAWTKSIEEVVDYWTSFNNTKRNGQVQSLPNINPNDRSTVEQYAYRSGENCVEVVHYKVLGGGHDWPGAWGNRDIQASEIIWDFFSQYTLAGQVNCNTVVNNVELVRDQNFIVYPSPTNDIVTVENRTSNQVGFELLHLSGQKLRSGLLATGETEIDLSNVAAGVYLLKIGSDIRKLYKADK